MSISCQQPNSLCYFGNMQNELKRVVGVNKTSVEENCCYILELSWKKQFWKKIERWLVQSGERGRWKTRHRNFTLCREIISNEPIFTYKKQKRIFFNGRSTILCENFLLCKTCLFNLMWSKFDRVIANFAWPFAKLLLTAKEPKNKLF